MTKILQLQYILRSSGDFAIRLHHEFLKAGLESKVFGLISEIEGSAEIKGLGRKEKMISRLDNRLQKYVTRKSKPEFGAFSNPIFGNDLTKHKEIQEADVLYFHWVLNGFLNFKNFDQLARLGKPMIFIMHDMWLFTGGCHYAFSCLNYMDNCSNCQMFEKSDRVRLAEKVFKKKNKLFSKYNNLYFVSPSRWLYDCAKKSKILQNKPVFHIPNILDRNVFSAFEKKVAKQILNIDEKETIIAFGAVSVDSPYKGWPYLKSALNHLKERYDPENVTILIFGSKHNEEIAKSIPFKIRFMGRLRDEYTLKVVYNSADIFIAPSLADNLPYTIYEALSCGTPVVGFNVGGIPDLIKHKENGYLAEYKNAEDLSRGIAYCLENKTMGKVPSDLDNEKSIKKHLDLIRSLVGPSKRANPKTQVNI